MERRARSGKLRARLARRAERRSPSGRSCRRRGRGGAGGGWDYCVATCDQRHACSRTNGTAPVWRTIAAAFELKCSATERWPRQGRSGLEREANRRMDAHFRASEVRCSSFILKIWWQPAHSRVWGACSRHKHSSQ